MNLKAGYPFWLVKNGLPHDFPKLDKNIETEVVIIGGGISGALMRYYLIDAGINCVLVDGRTIGLGSTCASTSLLQYEIDTPLSELKNLVGEQNAERSFQLCDRAITELGKIAKKMHFEEFEFRDSLYFAAYKKDIPFLKEEFEARKKAGFDIEWLDSKAINSKFGFDAPAGILSHHGAETNAYSFMHHLMQHQKNDFPVYDRTVVSHIKHHQNGVELQTEDGFELKCKKLVYATGYEAVNFIDKNIVKLLSTYAIISEQLPTQNFWKGHALLWNTADPYLYMRTTADGRILIGGRDEDFYNPKKRDQLIPKKSKQLAADFKKLFPETDFKTEFSWTGTFGSTKDGLPFIGTYKKLPNSYFALGFGGNGITFSQIAAEIITDLIQGKANKDAAIFSFDRI